MEMTPEQWAETERRLVALLVAAAAATPFGHYYPDADVVIRWRDGVVLPDVDIRLKRREKKDASMHHR